MQRHTVVLALATGLLAMGGCAVGESDEGSYTRPNPAAGAGGAGESDAGGDAAGAPASDGGIGGGESGASGESGAAGSNGPAPGGGAGEPSTGGASGTGGSSTGGASGQGPDPHAFSPGFLHTIGSKIVDDTGNPVRLTGINWFGLETSNYAPHGLWSRSMDELLDVIDSLGYNVIRLPFSNQLFDPGNTPSGIDFNQNPALTGLSGLQVIDKVVEGAGSRGIRVILDRHRPDANSQSALWYTDTYTEQRWIDDWTMLAARYAGNPTVIGADLHNEPHGSATWGSGDTATDWRLAAQKAGNAILGVNPDLLIVVEGIDSFEGAGYWWGGNLKGAEQYPVQLSVPGRLVYSTHDYPASVYHQTWFDAPDYPNNLEDIWRDRWAYLLENDTAPVLLGEFGTRYETDSDRKWLQALAGYIAAKEMSFTFWCLNPNSGDTGGILMDDWVTVHQDKQNVLAPLLAPQFP